MHDLISRAAAEAIIADMHGLCRSDALSDAMKAIHIIPAMDAVLVVRCRDCRYYDGFIWCENIEHGVEDNWFCADGEAKEE